MKQIMLILALLVVGVCAYANSGYLVKEVRIGGIIVVYVEGNVKKIDLDNYIILQKVLMSDSPKKAMLKLNPALTEDRLIEIYNSLRQIYVSIIDHKIEVWQELKHENPKQE
jgi:hypothetical protein